MTTIAILQVPKGQSDPITIPNDVNHVIVVHQVHSGLFGPQTDKVLHVLNERGNLPCGRWNHAIDTIILNRFKWDIKLNETLILLEDWNTPICLLHMLQAGGYDEALSSFYHEDLLIRLGEITPEILSQKIDMSTILESSNQSANLFKMKHQFRLEQQEWQQISEKTRTKETELKINSEPMPVELKNSIVLPNDLVVGVTLGNIELAERFLQSFSVLSSKNNSPIKLVICLYKISSAEVEVIVERLGLGSIEILIHDEEWGHFHGQNGSLGPWFLHEESRKGVSWGRCVLHYAIWLQTNTEEDPIIWILDDDIVVEPQHLEKIAKIAAQMKSNGFTIGIGQVLGDPPLLPIYTIRTQLIDYYYANLAMRNPSRKRIPIKYEQFNEMHHDLSTAQMDHLEFPIGFSSALDNEIDIQAVMGGKSVTREVHCDWESQDEIPARGGNTLLLDASPLSKWPNVAPNCGGIQFRRGDSLWTQWVALEAPESICSIPLAVPQIRLVPPPALNSVNSIRGDIAGSMLVRAIKGIKSVSEISSSELDINILLGSKLRESRLIANLLRVLHLMRFIGIEEHYIKKIEDLSYSLFNEDWPESFTNDLDSFLNEIYTSMKIFNRKHKSHSNY